MASFMIEVSEGEDGLWRVDTPQLSIFPGDLVVWVSRSATPFQVVAWEPSAGPPDFMAAALAAPGEVEEGLPPSHQAMVMTSGAVAWQSVQWRASARSGDIAYAVRALASSPALPGTAAGSIRIDRLATTAAGGGVSPPGGKNQQK
jgi:hypothetical protein